MLGAAHAPVKREMHVSARHLLELQLALLIQLSKTYPVFLQPHNELLPVTARLAISASSPQHAALRQGSPCMVDLQKPCMHASARPPQC